MGRERPSEQPWTPYGEQMAALHSPIALGLIWAQDKRTAIGGDGTVPWSVPENLARIERVTDGHPVIMGRRTWDSLPASFRPLQGRTNLVISRSDDFEAPGACVVRSLDDALESIGAAGAENAWIIGGGQILSEAAGQASVAIVAEIDHSYNGNIYAPGLGSEWALISTEPGGQWSASTGRVAYQTRTYRKS